MAGTEDGIVMVEAGANEVSEEVVIGAIDFGHDCCKKIAAAIRELMAKTGKPKKTFETPKLDQAIWDKISAKYRGELADALNTGSTASWRVTPACMNSR